MEWLSFCENLQVLVCQRRKPLALVVSKCLCIYLILNVRTDEEAPMITDKYKAKGKSLTPLKSSSLGRQGFIAVRQIVPWAAAEEFDACT